MTRPSAPETSAPVYAIAAPVQVLWLLSGLLGAALLTIIVAIVDYRVLARVGDWPFAPGSTVLAAGTFFVLRALLWPNLAYRAWRFSLREHDVWMRYGVLWRTRRSVPRVRIQHVDVESGPLERLFGLASLVIYTAGTGDADARIPGLRIGSAEWLRDELLPRGSGVRAELPAPPSAMPQSAGFKERKVPYARPIGSWPNTPHPGLSQYPSPFLTSPDDSETAPEERGE